MSVSPRLRAGARSGMATRLRPAIQYSGTWFDGLGEDEVVVVEGRWPEARYCSVVLLSRWMESGDWRHHRCVLTSRELEVAPDGSFRVVVAHRDPGEPNWLDTTGLVNGSIAIRTLGADDQLQVEFRREPGGGGQRPTGTAA